MANTLTINGQAATLRWGYHLAATIGPWSVTRAEEGAWIFVGTILTHDAVRVSQHPLDVVTPNGWRWPVTSLQITGASLTATLSPKEP